MGVMLLLSCLMLILATAYSEPPVKWCILENEVQKCNDMKAAFAKNGLTAIECVNGIHEARCLRMIRDKEADIKSVSDRGIFAGGKFDSLVPFMSEKRTGKDAESFNYKAVVVVKKDGGITKITDIKGKRSCHTGVMRTVGWVVPMGVLYEKAGMTLATDADACDNNVKSVAKFFKQSCAPGAYDPYNNPNNNNPDNICARCQEPRCPSNDKYSSYVGAFRGLVDGRCDLAFVKHSTKDDAKAAFSFTESDYRLVCPDGTLKALSEWNQCNWATRPTPALVTRSNAPHSTYVKMMSDAVKLFGPSGTKKAEFEMFNSTKYNGSNILFADKTISLSEISDRNYTKHLGEGFLNSYEKFRPKSCKKSFRWCVISDAEMKKCEEFSSGLGAMRITLDLTCVQTTNPDSCMKMIKENKADAVTVDGGHVYTGGKYFGLKPIMAEIYNEQLDDATYTAVAVTLKTKQVNLQKMGGKKTCHTGFERTSGWNVPIGYFANRGDIKIDPKTCNTGTAATAFFGDMCVPGALESQYNHGQKNPEKMCALCKGDCQYNGKYNGYTGAIRCLIEKGGDVAFVKHTTIDDVINSGASWAAGKTKNDFVVLCKDGTKKPVDQWANCNLAKVPSHAVLTSKDREDNKVQHYQIALDRAQIKYGYNTKDFFRMFYSKDGKDLLFKDSTKKLKKINDDYEKFLGQDYLNTVSALDARKCSVGASNSIKFSFVATTIAAILSISTMF